MTPEEADSRPYPTLFAEGLFRRLLRLRREGTEAKLAARRTRRHLEDLRRQSPVEAAKWGTWEVRGRIVYYQKKS